MLFAFAGIPQVNRTLFNDFEGSRGEFLKILLEQGEVPAFIRRAQSVTESWIQICDHCRSQRKLMLRWPWMHLSILANRLKCDWSLLARYLVDERQVTYIEALHVDWKDSLERRTVSQNSWSSVRDILGEFVESVNRFNNKWNEFLQLVNLDEVNRLRRDYNKYYSLEKACAFDSEDMVRLGFKPLDPATSEQLYIEFPLLATFELHRR